MANKDIEGGGFDLSKGDRVSYKRFNGDRVTWLVDRVFDDRTWAVIQFDANSLEKRYNTGITLLTSNEDVRKAIELQRRLGLISVAEILMETSSRVCWSKKNLLWEDADDQSQNTWVFIVYGIYSWNWVYKPYATVIKASPWVTAWNLSMSLIEKFPRGFENIPTDSNELPGTSHWDLVWYNCLELTERAAELIDWNPKEV